MSLVVVGSGPAGVAAAAAYRAADGDGSVVVVSTDAALPYERPPLSKDLLRGETTVAQITLHDADFYRDRDIELRLGRSVSRLDPDAAQVLLADGDRLPFDTCVLATGARPARLEVPGADLPQVHTLRSLDDGVGLRDAAANGPRVVVVGSGFIGCEAAISLARAGCGVTLATDEPLPQLGRLGEWAATRIADWLRADGVRLLLGAKVASVETVEDGVAVRTERGNSVRAELVLMASGVTPNAGLADDAGLRLERGRIRTDTQLRTSSPAVFAAGDVAFAHHERAGRPLAVEHWGDALAMGEIAGTVAAGGHARWTQSPGFWTQLGDRTLKYAAWGDGYDEADPVEHGQEAFTVRYRRGGELVGVLAYNADDDYDAGSRTLEGR